MEFSAIIKLSDREELQLIEEGRSKKENARLFRDWH